MPPVIFDPYHKWLGIPPHEQPPTHYRLLGLSPFESDPDVIDRAADARMAILKTVVAGPNANLSQTLLSQVAAARLCLLNPQSKQAYDSTLRGPAPPTLVRPATTRRAPKPRASSNANQIFVFKVVAGGVVGLALGYAIVVGVLGIDPFGAPTTAQAPARKPVELPPPQTRPAPQPKQPPSIVQPERSARPNGMEGIQPRLPGFPQDSPAPKPTSPEPSPPQFDLTPQVRPPVPAPILPPAPPPTPKPPLPIIALADPSNGSAKQLHEAFSQISNELARILKLDTTAHQNEEHKEMIDRLNGRLESKKFEFNFPVLNVGEIRGNRAEVTLGRPAETSMFEINKGVRVETLSRVYLQAPDWSQKEIVAIRKQDTIRISGRRSIPAAHQIRMTSFQ